ncbi:hypothetical protein ACVXHB_01905 [Escherichia coli]
MSCSETLIRRIWRMPVNVCLEVIVVFGAVCTSRAKWKSLEMGSRLRRGRWTMMRRNRISKHGDPFLGGDDYP